MTSEFRTMVLIPGGTFVMGCDQGNSNELPAHEVAIGPFFLDTHAVTNVAYRAFLLANPAWRKGNVDPALVDDDYLNIWDGEEYPEGLDDYAVINVSWYAAAAYAAWIGKRLPTEAEWEFAAGGPTHTRWSLGDQFKPSLYCFGQTEDPIGYRVGQFPANGFGLYDMSGGVWEWVLDSYEVDYYTRSPRESPFNSGETGRKALRGGSGYFDTPAYLRCAVRGSNDPRACHEDYGFRCARNV